MVYSILAEAPHDVVFYWRMRAWIDFGLMLLTFFSTVIWSVEVGILVSVTVSLLLVVHKSGQTRMSILVRVLPERRTDADSGLVRRGAYQAQIVGNLSVKTRMLRRTGPVCSLYG